jgi:hypothetical protein
MSCVQSHFDVFLNAVSDWVVGDSRSETVAIFAGHNERFEH